MARYGLSDLEFVIFSGVDVTGMVNSFSDEIANETEDVVVAGVSVDRQGYVGVSSGTVNLSGFYDSVMTATLDNAAAAVLMYGLEGNVAGRACECVAKALPGVYKRSQASKALHKADLNFGAQGAAAIDHALLVAPLATRTGASGNADAAYVDGLAKTEGGGRFYVSLPDLTLGDRTNIIIKLRDSADHITFADVAGAAATFIVPGAQMIAVSGTIERYLSMSWAYTGGTTGQSCGFVPAAIKIAA